MWSAGAVLLEILTGFPLWLSLKARVELAPNKNLISHGVFAVQGKAPEKILQKQKEAIERMGEVLARYECFDKDPQLLDLLCRMLDPNPKTRISPREALSHPCLIGI